MGLFTALLTLPLAPVRGTVWIAEKLQEQAELELYDESAIEAGLLELQVARESGAVEGPSEPVMLQDAPEKANT